MESTNPRGCDSVHKKNNVSRIDVFKDVTEKADAVLRMAVMGIGNYNRGDDAIGAHIISSIIEEITGIDDYRHVLKFESANGAREIMLIAAGVTPENFVDDLIAFQPELILYVDCANFNDASCASGTIHVFEENALAESKSIVSTHSLSINLLLEIFKKKIPGSKNLFIGIMPESIEYNYSPDYIKNFSSSVVDAGNKIISYIKTTILNNLDVKI